MILYPAIDLKDGQCVRLLRGEMDRATVYSDSPAQQARRFQDLGCEWLHVVDLDGAVRGKPANAAAIGEIVSSVRAPIQLGGGIRDLETIGAWLERGVTRIILGTLAVEDPDLVRQAARRFGGRIAVGLDARDGLVATRGWTTQTKARAEDLARRFEDAGVAAIVYTDISRDGAMEGPNVDATAALAQSVEIPVIASGGVSSLADLRALRDCGAGLNGVICGRAIYDGAIDPSEAIALLRVDRC